MTQRHGLIGKKISYVELDRSIETFAKDHCDGVDCESLIIEIEWTIMTQHGEGKPVTIQDLPQGFWSLETRHVTFTYQIFGDTIEIGDIRSKKTGEYYEASDWGEFTDVRLVEST